jgi:histidinol-phosphate aminotransferase
MKNHTLPAPREGLFASKLYKPGRPIQEVLAECGLTSAHKLASNENLFGISPKALEAIAKNVPEVRFYPDNSCVLLTAKLAKRLEVKPEQIVWGNGSVELIYDLLNAYTSPGDEMIMGAPSFSAYPIATRVHQGVAVEVPLTGDHRLDLEAMAAAITPRTKLVFLPNPNNPTGTIVSAEELDTFLKRLPDGVLAVLDEAYYDFIVDPSYPDSLKLFKEGAPLMILRSLSKSLGIAGIRVGYGVLPAEMATALRQVQVPFHVSLLAQGAVMAGMDDHDFLIKTRDLMIEARDYLMGALKERNLEAVPSHANFLMMRMGIPAREAAQKLLYKGFIVRPGEDLGAPGWLRVTVAPIAIMKEFMTAVDEVLAGP